LGTPGTVVTLTQPAPASHVTVEQPERLCADAGIVIVAYSDDASGVAIEQADGAGRFESVTLRPNAKLAAGSDENIARRLHDVAAEKWFIASVSFEVEYKPRFEIAWHSGAVAAAPCRCYVGRSENPR